MSQVDPEQQPERYRLLDNAEKYNAKIIKPKGVRRFSHWLEACAVEHALNHASGNRVLDCPCGTGRIDGLLRAKFSQVVGLDSSEACWRSIAKDIRSVSAIKEMPLIYRLPMASLFGSCAIDYCTIFLWTRIAFVF